MSQRSLAHLLQKYCNVQTNKSLQLADWRIRYACLPAAAAAAVVVAESAVIGIIARAPDLAYISANVMTSFKAMTRPPPSLGAQQKALASWSEYLFFRLQNGKGLDSWTAFVWVCMKLPLPPACSNRHSMTV